MSGGYRRAADGGLRPDWREARLGDSAPCVHGCGENTILRHPITGRPCHKACDDKHAADEQTALEQRLTGPTAGHRPAGAPTATNHTTTGT